MEVAKEPALALSSGDPASTKEPYQYEPLQDASNIRLLKIASHSKTSAVPWIEVELEDFSLRQAPRYTALSYTWGASERAEQIIVGKDSYLCVTQNLFGFLLYICKKESEYFWIDAVCINQDDLQERGFQVKLMKQIFQQATEVLVWLYQPSLGALAGGTSWDIVEKDKDRRLTKLPLWSLKMFHHAWFMRVWVLQEVVYARAITIVCQRDDEKIAYITWDEALNYAGGYLDRYIHDDRNTPVEEDVELSIAMMVSMNDWRGKVENDIFDLNISELLSNTRFSGASELKDKVFAILSLASDVDLNTFEIDYSMSWKDISVRLTQHTISQSNTLDILRWKGIPRPTTQLDDLPSWVPDLSSPALLAPLYPYDWPNRGNLASDDSPDVTLMCNEKLLVAKCLKLLDIDTIAPDRLAADHLERYRDILAVLQKWYQTVRKHSAYVHDQKRRINSFCGTLKMTLGSRGLEEHIENIYNAGLGWQWHFRKLLGEDLSSYGPEDPHEFAYELDDAEILSLDNPHLYTPWAREAMFGKLDHLHGRSFGFTSGGHMMLLPSDAQEGDHVCLLYGIRLPFILRQDRDGYCQVIGACYVHQHFNWDVFESRGSWEQLQLITLR